MCPNAAHWPFGSIGSTLAHFLCKKSRLAAASTKIESGVLLQRVCRTWTQNGLFIAGWSCTKGGGAARRLCSRDRCSANAGRLDEWSGGYCSSRVPLQKPPTSSVWFAFPWDLTILSSPAGPGSTHPSHRLAAPAAPHLGMPPRQLAISFWVLKKIIHIGNFRA